MRLTATLFSALLGLAGCSNYTEFTQNASGTLRVGGTFASGVDVAIIQGTSGPSCVNPTVFSTTGPNGQFSGSRTAVTGKFAVIVQHDTLCIREAGMWRMAWSGIYGPAPESVVFLCSKQASSWQCTLNNMATQRE